MANYDNRRQKINFVECDVNSAELIKHASNAYLATRLSFVNELALLCEKVEANIENVTFGMGLDPRIGSLFLKAGPGWGGSCFPKDTKELLHLSKNNDSQLTLVDAAITSNVKHQKALANKIINGERAKPGSQITVLGLSFKANTDDIRESPSIQLIKNLTQEGFLVHAYDPMSGQNFSKLGLDCCVSSGLWESVKDSVAIVIMTEWREFSDMDLNELKRRMSGNNVYDFRNVLSVTKAKAAGLNLISLGV